METGRTGHVEARMANSSVSDENDRRLEEAEERLHRKRAALG